MRPVKQGGCVVAEDTVFSVLYDKFMFWSILVGILTFGWMFLAMLRYRDGVEPDTTAIDHIEVGSFPVDRHHTPLEVMFYVLPTILVTWLVVLALSSNTAVWQWTDDTSQTFDMEITGKQWFWEYEYKESLTWEDEPATTLIDVTWNGTTLLVTSTNDAAVNFSGFKGTESIGPIALDSITGTAMQSITFNSYVHSTIEVTDADGVVLHTWMHIPKGHMFSSALGEDMILPCDQRVVFEMHSAPSDDSNPNYIGVQHSFWLPEWGVKEDLVPGIEGGTYMTVEPDDPGTYPIRCAEYCGNQHSMMVGQVTVVAMEGSDCSTDSGVKKTKGTENGGDY